MIHLIQLQQENNPYRYKHPEIQRECLLLQYHFRCEFQPSTGFIPFGRSLRFTSSDLTDYALLHLLHLDYSFALFHFLSKVPLAFFEKKYSILPRRKQGVSYSGAELIRTLLDYQHLSDSPNRWYKCVAILLNHLIMGGKLSGGRNQNNTLPRQSGLASSMPKRLHSPPQNIQLQTPQAIQQEKAIWNDDDEIYENKNIAQALTTEQLLKLLKVEVKASQKIIKLKSNESQIIPAMVSLKSDNLKKNETETAKQGKSARPGIDLICVIDVSGSMSGTKIQLVQKSLSYIVELLGQSDRISLITFESFATRLIPLLRVTPANVQKIAQAIGTLSGRGGTSIFAGMNMAFKTLRDKKYKNNVESVFLLSDGLDGGADQRITQALNSDIKLLKSSAFSVHTFGYGSDHDPKLMKNIADVRDGNFFFIEKYETLDEAVANCMGGLFSVIASQINLTVKSELKGNFADIRITKAFGDITIYNDKKNQYNIKLSQFFSGISKNFMFEVSIPPNSHEIGDLERSQTLIEAVADVKPVGKGQNIQVKGELTVTFLNENQELKQTDPDSDVMENYLRVKAVQLMKQNLKLMQEKKYDLVEKNIGKMEQQLDGYKYADKSEKLVNMRNDMKKMKVQMQQQDYVNGMNFMMENERCHSRERNFAYQNKCQQSMITNVRMKKSKY